MSTGEKTVTADAVRLRVAPRCGARTRAGTACRSPAVHGRSRCRMHGGGGGKLCRSGAPRGNRNAWKDGYWAAAARLRRRQMTAFIRDMEASLAETEAMARAPAHAPNGTFDEPASGAWRCFPFFLRDAPPPVLQASAGYGARGSENRSGCVGGSVPAQDQSPAAGRSAGGRAGGGAGGGVGFRIRGSESGPAPG